MDNSLSLIEELRLIKNIMHLKNVNEMVLNNLKNSIVDTNYLKRDIKTQENEKKENKKRLAELEKELEEEKNKSNSKGIKKTNVLRLLKRCLKIPLIILIVGVVISLIEIPIVLSSSSQDAPFSPWLGVLLFFLLFVVVAVITFIVLIIKHYGDYIYHFNNDKIDEIIYKIITIKQYLKNSSRNINDESKQLSKGLVTNKTIVKSIKEHEEYLTVLNNALEKVKENSTIHKKYFSFVHICQFYEYIDTGRCDRLEGSDGCYNLFELELRLNRIIDRLDTISLTLEEISKTLKNIEQSMYVLCNEVRAINSQFGSFLKCYETMEKEKGQNFEIINSNLKYIKATQTFLIKDDLPYATKGLTLLKAYGDLKY